MQVKVKADTESVESRYSNKYLATYICFFTTECLTNFPNKIWKFDSFFSTWHLSNLSKQPLYFMFHYFALIFLISIFKPLLLVLEFIFYLVKEDFYCFIIAHNRLISYGEFHARSSINCKLNYMQKTRKRRNLKLFSLFGTVHVSGYSFALSKIEINKKWTHEICLGFLWRKKT